MVRIRSRICIRIQNYSEIESGSGINSCANPPGIHAHASEGRAADCSSCRRRRLPASCQTRSPAQHRTRASADQRRTCTKKELLKTASCQTRSPALHRTRASADQRRTCTKKELLKTEDDVCQHRVKYVHQLNTVLMLQLISGEPAEKNY